LNSSVTEYITGNKMAIKYNSFAFNELRKLKGDVNSS
jgi:hypothetical protein